ncbi:hypothetical protein JX265_002080 [Neoarthrinium moseri]|uniref:Major facilitator superfamily (MFS) profile domain-containing protein n=1 Tax=Neoarthrinium moseri TaxID=1658444 RepID=A0A9Q0ATX5_9PEZI|nr:hypothetical protein JX266_013061 [Neoarthrinium moseri]KAI1880459.1 hypothetical protein JX265_002080 [Neoarthrinium moseri]
MSLSAHAEDEKRRNATLQQTPGVQIFLQPIAPPAALGDPSLLSTLAHGAGQNSTTIDLGHMNQKRDGYCPSDDDNNWKTDCWNTRITIYEMIEENSLRSILIVSIASLVGSIAAIIIINVFRRKYILTITFSILSILLAVAGGTLLAAQGIQNNYFPTTVFYSLLQFVFNIGPNPILFVMPAEIFPTVYRGTFYGIAAASGKIGAIIIGAIINHFSNAARPLGIRLLIFTPLMLVSAVVSWYLPDVQYPIKHSDVETNRQGETNSAYEHTNNYESGLNSQPVIQADQRSEISSDDSLGPEPQARGPGTGQLGGHFLGRLANIPLEEIAPNPIRRSRTRAMTAEANQY